jgi:hypothetical protein
VSPYVAVRRPARGRRPARAAGVKFKINRQQRRARTASANYALPMAGQHYLSGGDDGLGFSLKPPKWVRKAATTIKKNVTLKRALIGGAIVGAAFIPGVGPAALAAARAVGGAAVRGISAVGRGIVGAGGAIEHGVVGLFKKKAPKYGPFPDQPDQPDQGTPTTPSGNTPSTPSGGGGGTPSGGGGTYGPSPDQGGGSSYGGGGGTYGPSPDQPSPDDGSDSEPVPMPDATATTDDTTTPPQAAGALPILLGIGTLALLAKRNGGRQ